MRGPRCDRQAQAACSSSLLAVQQPASAARAPLCSGCPARICSPLFITSTATSRRPRLLDRPRPLRTQSPRPRRRARPCPCPRSQLAPSFLSGPVGIFAARLTALFERPIAPEEVAGAGPAGPSQPPGAGAPGAAEDEVRFGLAGSQRTLAAASARACRPRVMRPAGGRLRGSSITKRRATGCTCSQENSNGPCAQILRPCGMAISPVEKALRTLPVHVAAAPQSPVALGRLPAPP
jgi:hypothetical protein